MFVKHIYTVYTWKSISGKIYAKKNVGPLSRLDLGSETEAVSMRISQVRVPPHVLRIHPDKINILNLKVTQLKRKII